jgi:hypothetical protein
MEEGSRKIKRYSEFMPKKGFMRMMSQIEVSGTIKRGFFSRPRNFELQVYFTPVKKIIVDIVPTGISINDLKLTFERGDHIDKLREWVDKNGHEIVIEINK